MFVYHYIFYLPAILFFLLLKPFGAVRHHPTLPLCTARACVQKLRFLRKLMGDHVYVACLISMFHCISPVVTHDTINIRVYHGSYQSPTNGRPSILCLCDPQVSLQFSCSYHCCIELTIRLITHLITLDNPNYVNETRTPKSISAANFPFQV